MNVLRLQQPGVHYSLNILYITCFVYSMMIMLKHMGRDSKHNGAKWQMFKNKKN